MGVEVTDASDWLATRRLESSEPLLLLRVEGAEAVLTAKQAREVGAELLRQAPSGPAPITPTANAARVREAAELARKFARDGRVRLALHHTVMHAKSLETQVAELEAENQRLREER